MTEARTASDPGNQLLLDQRDADPKTRRCECGAPLFYQGDCRQCGGDDPYGDNVFCPVEDFCCGC